MRNDFIQHHGILGQKWGVRRYQNPDGTLTEAGRKRYGVEGKRTAEQFQNRLNDYSLAVAKNKRAVRQFEGQSNLGEKVERHKRLAKSGEKEIKKLLSDAKKAGLDVTSRDFYKVVNSNEDRLMNAIYALMPFWNISLTVGNAVYKRTLGSDDHMRKVTKYTVTKK